MAILKKKRRFAKKYTLKEQIFVYAWLIVPLVQFFVMWVLVKADSLVLAFQSYDNGSYVSAGFENFKQIFTDYFTGNQLMLKLTGNSLLIFLAGLAFYPIPLYISYVIWKKVPFSNFFKVIMYVPCIIPGMVTTLAFRYFMGLGLPGLFNNPALSTLITSDETMNVSLFIYGKWIGVGGSFVINLGAMAAVDKSLVEYGKLDGLDFFGEFWHIVLPKIWPTMVVQVIGMVSGMLNADVGLYGFFRETKFGNLNTNLGYHESVLTLRGPVNYGYLSALGLLKSAILIPVIYLVRWAMEKFGPSEDM